LRPRSEIKIVFFGTPNFAVPILQKLVELGYDVELVITQPDKPGNRNRTEEPPVKLFAKEIGLSVVQPETLKSSEVVEILQSKDPDLIVLASYGKIIPKKVLDISRYGALNVHPSLLPRWRGASPVQAAILSGDAKTGVSVFLMDEGMDTGPILIQHECEIRDDDTTVSLSERLSKLGAELLDTAILGYLDGNIIPKPQDDSKATYAPLIHKENGNITWNEPAFIIDRKVRALNPWPGVKANLLGNEVKILRGKPSGMTIAGKQPGTILGLVDDAVMVACGDSTAYVVELLQLPSRKPVTGKQFLIGTRVPLREIIYNGVYKRVSDQS